MKLSWDKIGEHFFEAGVDHMVLFPFNTVNSAYDKGVAWNGITGITESPSGAESNPQYADNIKYLNLISAEEYGSTITAFTYPDEWEPMNGRVSIAPGVTIGQQSRKMFGYAYRTLIGNDTEGTDHGYKLKLVYGAQAAPSEESHNTINDSPEAAELSWEVSTTPVSVTGHKPTSVVTIDSTKTDPAKLAAFESILYGTDGVVSYSSVTPSGSENPATEGWYEKVGDVYSATTDSSVSADKTYYEKVTTGGTDSRLPLPDEVATLLGVAVG